MTMPSALDQKKEFMLWVGKPLFEWRVTWNCKDSLFKRLLKVSTVLSTFLRIQKGKDIHRPGFKPLKKSFYWFNKSVYWFKKEIKQNQMYLILSSVI